jgi:hypothetical protein
LVPFTQMANHPLGNSVARMDVPPAEPIAELLDAPRTRTAKIGIKGRLGIILRGEGPEAGAHKWRLWWLWDSVFANHLPRSMRKQVEQ